MPIFEYKVRDKSGKLGTGVTEAASKEALADKLTNLGYFIISISERRRVPSLEDLLASFGRVKIEEMVMLTVQLASMIGAGISLPNCLRVLTEQIENKRLKGVLGEVNEDIKGGSTFSDALRKHPDIFPTLFVSMIHSGEMAGNLEIVLKRLSIFLEKEAELKQKVLTALFYPIILAIMGTVVVVFIITTMLPTFTRIFLEANIPLPLPTKILYTVNLAIRGYWKYFLGGAAAAYIGFRWFVRTPRGKAIFDMVKLKIPVWGSFNRTVTIARLSRTLATLISSGVPMLQALETLEKTIDNAVMSKVIKNVSNSVNKGQTISKPLKDSGEFPPMPVHMIAIGEESGAIDEMLNKVADFYEMATDYRIRRLTALLEPIFLVIIGGMVGFIFASILLPIFKMVGTLRR